MARRTVGKGLGGSTFWYTLLKMDPEPASPSQSKPSRAIARSCHSCNQKKIRCDKKDPCSACTRARRPCVFPPQGPRIRRTKKTIMADMSSRLSDLEKTLSRARDQPKSPPVGDATRLATAPPTTKSSSYRSPVMDTSREDVLVQSGSSSHYFNEVLVARAIRAVSQP